MDSKKISFGFMKAVKKPLLIKKPEEKKVELIESLEGQSIKLKNEIIVEEKQPLVIPLRGNKKSLLDRLKELKDKKAEAEDNRPDSELNEDELAARELIREAKRKLNEREITDDKNFVVPLKVEDKLEGEAESTLNDYENIPIEGFGVAMLRGMGWKEGTNIGKNTSNRATANMPSLRPKGLGLGATIGNEKEDKRESRKNEPELILKVGSCAKIIAGSQKGNYCNVEAFDDYDGRVVVKTALTKDTISLNEFMLVPVTKEEYAKNSKVINSAKFEEYKQKENALVKTERDCEEGSKSNSTEHNSSENAKYSNNDSRYKNKPSFSNKHDSSDTDSDHEISKKVHKRKDKKRHKDRSRSPSTAKHKKNKKSSKSRRRYSSSDSDREQSRYRNRNSSDSSRRKNKR